MTQSLKVRGMNDMTLDAREDRLINEILTAGLLTLGDEFKVVQQASPNMTVRVGSGVAGDRYVVTGTGGSYLIRNPDTYIGSANSDVSIANGHASLARIDGIDLVVYDDSVDSSGFSKAEVIVTQGTPAASPAAPAVPTAYAAAVRLATIAVSAAESTSIVTGEITDARQRSMNMGGVGVCTSSTRPSSPVRGQMIFETDTGNLYMYYGATNGWQKPWNLPWGVQGTPATLTGSIAGTGETLFTGSTSVTALANRRLKITASVGAYTAAASGTVTLRIKRSSTVLAISQFQVNGSNPDRMHAQNFSAIETSTAGTLTYTVSTQGLALGIDPAVGISQLWIEDMGPTSSIPSS